MPTPTVSLHRRLQASSLAAVLAGYALLLVANRELSARSRLASHRQTVELLGMELRRLPATAAPAAFQSRLERTISPGRLLWLELEPGRPYRPPTPNATVSLPVPLPQLLAAAADSDGNDHIRAFQLGGHSYLCSSQPLDLSGRPARLRMLEDVTDDLERQRIVQLLLVAAAGLSSLFTSALLRLVLRRGLRPLDRLSRQLGGIDAGQLGQERLPLDGQPLELQPIVAAFNGLLNRLAIGRDQQRSFVDGVAHELRTPITLISGQAQSLQRHADASGSIGPAGLPPLRLIAAEAQRMGRLVTDLLDIARDDAGRLELSSGRVDLDDALLLVFERMQPLAAGRLTLQAPTEEEAPVAAGDADRLQQCLTNLVENALKYTPEGTPIELFSSRRGDHLIAHVRDHGRGVSLAERERIFGRFVRGTAQSSVSGSGLGLSMVRLLMERMGGGVRVADTPGGGADFQLLLPLADQPAGAEGTAADRTHPPSVGSGARSATPASD